MKILIINVVCGVKSTGRICTDLAEMLDAHGHEVKIAYGREGVPGKYKKYAVRIGTDFDVKIHAGLARVTDSSGFHSTAYTKRFIQWIKEYNPDVIHLHNIHGYYINVKLLFEYLKCSNKRVIWTMHDCWALTGHSVFCDAIDCEKWKTGCYHCPQLNEYPKSFIDRSKSNWIIKRNIFTGVSDMQIVTPSRWLANVVKESYMNEYPVQVIPNGIDTSVFRQQKRKLRSKCGSENKYIILAVANPWTKMKGLDDYLQLSKMLDQRFQIILVGLSKKQLTELPDGVVGIERTHNIEELVQLYSVADVFLNLTYTDTYPTVNLEARACGAKIVTYDTGGSPEAAGEDAIVVPKGDLLQVKTVLENLIENKNELSEEKRVKDSSETVEEYLKIYECRE